MINNQQEYEKMALVEHELWWYRILHEKVLKVIAQKKVTNSELILDIGCGTGGLMQKLSARGYKVQGIDISDTAVDYCKKKNLQVEQISILDFKKDLLVQKPKVIISNDSLYFFSDQEIKEILRGTLELLSEGGFIIVNFPVLKAFSGVHDLSVGIAKRKSKREVKQLFLDSGYEIVHLDQWPFLLSPLIFLVRTIQRMKLKIYKNVRISSDISLPTPLLNKLFYLITNMEQGMPCKVWGSSLFVVAMKK